MHVQDKNGKFELNDELIVDKDVHPLVQDSNRYLPIQSTTMRVSAI